MKVVSHLQFTPTKIKHFTTRNPPTGNRKKRTDRSIYCPLLVLPGGGGTPS